MPQLFIGGMALHLERKKRIRMLAQLSNHVIVCGYGRVGSNVAQELKVEGLPFVVIDPNPKKLPVFRKMVFWRCMVMPPTNNI